MIQLGETLLMMKWLRCVKYSVFKLENKDYGQRASGESLLGKQ